MFWEDGTVMLWNKPPQESVNTSRGRPRDFDLTIALFWQRMGTPLPEDETRADGTFFESGTAWEIEDALSAKRNVLVFRRDAPLSVSQDARVRVEQLKQFEAMEEYLRRDTSSRNGGQKRSLTLFKQKDDFREQIRKQLNQYVNGWLRERRSEAEAGTTSEESVSLPSQSRTVTRRQWSDVRERINFLNHDEAADLVESLVKSRSFHPGKVIGCVVPGVRKCGHEQFSKRFASKQFISTLPGVPEKFDSHWLKAHTRTRSRWERREDLERDIVSAVTRAIASQSEEESRGTEGSGQARMAFRAAVAQATSLKGVLQHVERTSYEVVIVFVPVAVEELPVLGRRWRNWAMRSTAKLFAELIKDSRDVVTSKNVILFLSLEYQRNSSLQFLSDALQQVLDALPVATVFRKGSRSHIARADEEVVVTDPLGKIDKLETEKWLRDYIGDPVDDVFARRVKSVIEQLFEQRRAWPLMSLLEKLDDTLFARPVS